MKTAFSTGPGFFAAETRKFNDLVPNGMMRFYVARIEAHDGEAKKGTSDDALSFKLLPAMAEGEPKIARALLQLHKVLDLNLEYLKREAKQQ